MTKLLLILAVGLALGLWMRAPAFQTQTRIIQQTQVGTFASLPATPVEGMLYGVNNANTATWGATISGAGANHVLAYYDGSAWTVAGK